MFRRVVGCLVVVVSAMGIAGAQADQFLVEGNPKLKGAEQPTGFPQFAELARSISPAVVNISVEGAASRQKEGDSEQLPQHPFLRPDEAPNYRSLGSGFLVSPSGLIVTSNHVIDKADKIIIRLLDDKTEYRAKLIGGDQKSDLALLKISANRSLPWLYVGDSDALDVGEWVIAIGNQFQLGQTVTAGIVSAKSRRVPGKLNGPYDAFIQTDASINPGSSGGPLVNTKGQVVGINTAIFSPTRGRTESIGFNIGIGFAIPVNLAKIVLSQLRDNGKVVRGQLGVIIQRVDSDVAQALKLPAPDGALVSDVVPGGPAAQAGVRRKDVIVSFDGQLIGEHSELPLLVANSPVGKSASIELIRAGKRITVTALLREFKDSGAEKEEPEPQPDRIGLVVQEVNEFVRKAFKLAEVRGVIVETVRPNSPAHNAGLTPGDVIEEIDGQVINTPDHLARVVNALRVNVPVLIMVRRKQGTRFVMLKIEQ